MRRSRLADAVGVAAVGELASVRDLLAGCSVRLVLTPEAVVVAEARRTLTALPCTGTPSTR